MNRAISRLRWQAWGLFADFSEPALTVVKKSAQRKLSRDICARCAG
jgi:hypothetical protein